MDFLKDDKQISTERAIVEAIVFFDMFDFPLTDSEVWKFIRKKVGFFEVQNILLSDALDGYLGRKNGFYFLRGRGDIVTKRLERYSFADRKFKRALLVSRFFSYLPWIKMIAVGNIIGPHNLKDDSDIDLFIVTESKKLWTVRFFTVVFTKLLGLRPNSNNTRDKICLSFFVSEDALNLKELMLDSSDYYFIYWLAGLATIYNNGLFDDFLKHNSWIYNYLPNWQPTMLVDRRQRNKPCIIANFVFDLFGFLENALKYIQIKIMPKKLKEEGNKDSKIIFNDRILKFHSNDRRQEYKERFINKMKEYEGIK